jgi:adenine C2-methylase RlmN of 23S rRNA A2503 and tRNA A37
MEQMIAQLEEAGYEYAVAVATKAEVEAGAACGQLSIITEKDAE